MTDAVGLLASAIGLVLVPVCLARLVLGRADLAALYRAPGADGWPPGVQEGDCPRLDLAGMVPCASDPAACDSIVGPGIADSGRGSIGEGSPEPGPVSDPGGAFVQPTLVVRGRVGFAGRRASAA